MKKMRILIATGNPAKFSDLQSALSDLPFEFVSLEDLGFREEFLETGKTFAENAEQKALFYTKKTGLPVLADDGGIEIKALGGVPGVKTRRWLDGKYASDKELIDYTLLKMKRFKGKERTACLKVVICLAFPSGEVYQSEAKINGLIAEKPYALYREGFPFDALLYFPNKKKYYYQVKYEDCLPINHRVRALKKIRKILIKKMIQ